MLRVVIGLVAVVLVSIGGGFAGQLAGHLLGKGDKNIALQSALIGVIAGAVLTVAVLASLAKRRRDWRMALGGIVATALELLTIAWIIWQRRV
jgi:hypothetical protein